MRKVSLGLLLIAVMFLIGCTSIESYSVITTKEVDLGKKYTKLDKVNQQYKQKVFIVIPVGPGYDESITETL